MAAGCTVGRIPGDSGHGRAWGAGEKKEDDEGIRFYTLLVVEMRRGGRISPKKRAATHCSEQASSPRRQCWARCVRWWRSGSSPSRPWRCWNQGTCVGAEGVAAGGHRACCRGAQDSL
jgi:hypothetical protein